MSALSDPDVTGGPLSWPDAALRYLYLLTLIVWLGGMVTLGALAAPAVFEILEAYDPEMGRVLAGDVFGEILRRFHFVAYGSGVILLGYLGAMATRRPRRERSASQPESWAPCCASGESLLTCLDYWRFK